jgi:hypothetical protein
MTKTRWYLPAWTGPGDPQSPIPRVEVNPAMSEQPESDAQVDETAADGAEDAAAEAPEAEAADEDSGE